MDLRDVLALKDGMDGTFGLLFYIHLHLDVMKDMIEQLLL